jgi:hypothetical protein
MPTGGYGGGKGGMRMDNIFHGCPPEGDGGDPDQNRLKNRIDTPLAYEQMLIGDVLALPWPKGIERRPRAHWKAEDLAAVHLIEGQGINLVGFLVGDKFSGPESCNCHSVTDRDYHLYLAPLKEAIDPATRAKSVVCEVSPRVLAMHPQWDMRALARAVKAQRAVRISGWLMLDPEHPDQVGKTRGTIWEIHPITAIELRGRDRKWYPLGTG